MLTRTIGILKNSNLFDQIIVSTDSEEVRQVALSSDATCKELRASELGEDHAPTIDVMSYEIARNHINLDSEVCCVYAPNPFLRIDALTVGAKSLNLVPIPNYVSTVTSFPFPIQRALGTNKDNLLEMVEKEYLMRHSQSLPERYHECAQFWWATARTWVSKVPMQEGLKGIYIPRWITQDIDTEEDWSQAEIRWQILQKDSKFEEYKVTEKNIIQDVR
jgi:CMP-N-acetylneuraminic acid synthetase